jgi:peptide/nickel transport system substrate-binding protein
MNKKILAAILTLVFASSIFMTGFVSTAALKSAATKTLIFSQGADPRGLDPAYVDDGESAKVMCNVYEGLLAYKPGSTEIMPSLATDWKISPDGKEYTFNLRKNVKFQDGTPFNADSVLFTVKRQWPTSSVDMPYASYTFDPTIIKNVEKVDDLTVKFTLFSKYTPFLWNLAMTLAAPIVSPTAVAKYGAKFIDNPVGTGPYSFVSWDKGQSIKLKAFEGYWGAKPKCDNLIFKFTKENAVRASDLITGGTDCIDGVDPNDVKTLKDNKMIVYEASGMNINYMAFNCSRAPFNNVKLREAISHAINRDELVKSLYQGYATVANSPLPTFVPGYDKNVQPYKYDVARAKSILKSQGKENLKIKMITYSNPRPYNSVGGDKLATAVQNYLAKIGVTATIESYNWTDYKKRVQNGEGDIFFYGWTGDNGDADNFMMLFETTNIAASLNSSKYSSKVVDALLKQARTAPNGAARNAYYAKIQEAVAKDAPWLPISHSTVLAAYNPSVTGFALHPTGSIFFSGVDKK